jgi:hypothetical protein
MTQKLIIANLVICTLISSIACKKLVTDPAPQTLISSQNVYSEDASTAAVLTGIYSSMMSNGSLQSCPFINISYYCSLSSDDLTLWPGSSDPVSTGFYTNELNNSLITGIFWEPIYTILYTTNAAIDGITNSNSLSSGVRNQALGEAYFMRAFCYFYLVNLYGPVPLVTTTNYKTNENIARSSTANVYNQIVADLIIAKTLLSTNYLDGTLLNTTDQRLRPTKWAAHALLSRAYLYTSDYKNAILEADSVINNTSTFNLDSLNSVFLTTSTEAIWQLQPVVIDWNTPDAQLFIIPNAGVSDSWPVYLSQILLNSFEPGDERKTVWVDSISANGSVYYYPFKYTNNIEGSSITEYEMVFRLGEIILIRSEAEANAGDLTDALTDLNSIRQRAGLTADTVTNDKTALITKILHERQVELFTEWGQRWFDLKRTNTLNSTMGSPTNEYQQKYSGGDWMPYYALYPISITELTYNPSLVQNPGY